MTPAKQRAWIIVLIGLGVLIVGFFGMRAFHAFRKFDGHRPPKFPPPGSEPAETNIELIRDWMTLGYISHTYRVPRKLLYETLGIPPNGNEEKSLKQLNDEYFPDQSGYVIEKVKAAIQANLPPTAPPPPTAAAP
jgi:hypothetical protein